MFGYVKKKVVRAEIERLVSGWTKKREEAAERIRGWKGKVDITDEEFEFFEEINFKNGVEIIIVPERRTAFYMMLHDVNTFNIYANLISSTNHLVNLLEIKNLI